MGSVVAQCLPLAVGVLVSPLPVIALILILLTPRARANGATFALGWLAGLIVVGLVGVLVLDQTPAYGSEGSSAVMRWAKGLAGAALLLLAVRGWRRRPRDGQAGETPGWMSAVDRFTPLTSAGLGLTLSGIKPKNLILTLAAAAVISEAGLTRPAELAALAGFVLVASLGILAPVVVYLVLGDRAEATLAGWSTWLTRNNEVVMSVVMLVFGLVLVGLALAG